MKSCANDGNDFIDGNDLNDDNDFNDGNDFNNVNYFNDGNTHPIIIGETICTVQEGDKVPSIIL